MMKYEPCQMPPLVIEMLLVQAQGFDDHQWVEPLWRLNDAHGSLAVFRFIWL